MSNKHFSEFIKTKVLLLYHTRNHEEAVKVIEENEDKIFKNLQNTLRKIKVRALCKLSSNSKTLDYIQKLLLIEGENDPELAYFCYY